MQVVNIDETNMRQFVAYQAARPYRFSLLVLSRVWLYWGNQVWRIAFVRKVTGSCACIDIIETVTEDHTLDGQV